MSNEIKKSEKEGGFLSSFFSPYFRDDIFNYFFKGEGGLPATNVKETKKAFNIELSVPGFDKGDFDLEVDNNVLTISAKKETSKEEKDDEEKVIHQEFVSSSFTRRFTLPDNVDTKNITAEHKDGLLKLELPKLDKAPEDRTKKIEIK